MSSVRCDRCWSYLRRQRKPGTTIRIDLLECPNCGFKEQ